MRHSKICVSDKSTDAWEPLRVALAWRVAAGDDNFVECVRADSSFDAPVVLAGCLGDEMAKARCILTSPIDRWARASRCL
jgi:hypothetical protein